MPRRQDTNKEIRDGTALYNPDIIEKGEPGFLHNTASFTGQGEEGMGT